MREKEKDDGIIMDSCEAKRWKLEETHFLSLFFMFFNLLRFVL